MLKRKIFVYQALLPSVLFLFFMTFVPVILIVVYSFTDYNYLSGTSLHFVGIENYRNVATDTFFRHSVKVTIYFMLLAVFFETLLGFAIALLVNSLTRQKKQILRVAFLLPSLLPTVTISLIWQMMLSNRGGIINQTMQLLGFDKVNWLMNISTAFYSILLIDIWQWTPFAFLLLYTTLQSVPQEQYEAASLDGAGFRHSLIHITLPNVYNGIRLVILLRTIDTFRLFDKINILTKGGPANSTATISQYIYMKGIENMQFGISSAAGILMIFLVILFLSVQLKKKSP